MDGGSLAKTLSKLGIQLYDNNGNLRDKNKVEYDLLVVLNQTREKEHIIYYFIKDKIFPNLINFYKEVNIMIETTAMLKELYRIFDALNGKYFDNELPSIFITLKQGKTKTKQVYGTFTPKAWAEKKDISYNEDTGNEVVVAGEERYHEIGMSAEYFTRPVANWCATLQHEMIHLYCAVNEIEDTSNGGHYHNKRFKAESEKRGLIIEKADVIGWSVTTPTTDFIAFIDSLEIDEDIFKFFRDTALEASKIAPKKRYVCPLCGCQVQAKKNMNIVCGDCEKRMDYWDLTDSDNYEILEDYNDGLAQSDEGWMMNMEDDE